jgi:hypothetical protein
MDLHLPSSLSPEKWAGYLPHKVSQAVGGKNVGSVERVLSGALGLFLLGMAMKRKGTVAKAMMIPAGLAALKRAATGKCEIYQAAGLSSADAPSVPDSSVRKLRDNFSKQSLDQGAEPLYI